MARSRTGRGRFTAGAFGRVLRPSTFPENPQEDANTQAVRFVQATSRKRLDQARAMLQDGMDVHVQEDMALNMAANTGYLPMVDLLLDAGANPWAVQGRALVQAARGGHLGVSERLLERMGTSNDDEHDPEAWRSLLRRALDVAVMGAHRPVAERLVQKGANPHGLSALDALMDAEVQRRHGVPLAQGSSTAQAIAQMGQASFHRHMDMVSWLLRQDPGTRSAGETGHLLMKAVDAGNMLWTEGLMRAEVDLPIERLEAALGLAMGHGFTPIVKAVQPVVMRRQRAVLDDAVAALMRQHLADGEPEDTQDVQRVRRRL